jgi:structural maintenance of chromosome 3 (chondroitin sulfate proteoglycan 6)
MSAYVEVTFDNRGGRFPSNAGKDEFVLRRTIGAKKDEYSMDRKNATKREVFDVLESAGLSRSNPFYIVPQGRVTAITNMKDEERLTLLKEISGSNVYEKRRSDSLKLLADTDQKCGRIDELVDDINARLQELEGEKKELEAWNKNDRERRALLYTMNARRKDELEELIEHIEQARHTGVANTDLHTAQFLQNEADMAQMDTEISTLKSEIKLLTDQRAQQERERKDAARHRAALELQRNDLNEGQSAAQQTQQQRDADLSRMRKEIEDRKKKLSKLVPRYEAKLAEETNVREQLAEAHGQRKRLEEKQGRSATYKTKRQRDDALRKRIDDITMDLAKRKPIQMQTDEDIQALREEIDTAEQEIAELQAKLDSENDNTSSLDEQVQEAQEAYDALLEKQKIAAREEERIRTKVSIAKSQSDQAENQLTNLLNWATSKGLQSLRTLQKDGKIDGIYGTVAELLQVPEPYKIAAEVAAGPALFSVVCDTDETAAKALKLLNSWKGNDAPGRVSFRPLDKIQGRKVDVPRTADAQPLLPKLRYEEVYRNVFEEIFANVVVCPELSICQSLARNHDVLALTPDGDRANKKGGYHGGYFDPTKSKLDAYRKSRELRALFDELQARQLEIQLELENLRPSLTAAASAIRKVKYQKQRAQDDYPALWESLRRKQRDVQSKQGTLKQLQVTANNITRDMNELGSQQTDLEDEIASEFKKTLSQDEETLLQSLTGTMRDLNSQVSALTNERSELENEKSRIESELRDNLNPQYEELMREEKISGNSGSQSTQLKECERALKAANKAVAALDSRIQELDAERQEANEQLQQYEEGKAEKEKNNRELAKLMEKAQRSMDRKLAERARHRDELAAVQRDIRELGTLPDEAYQKFMRWSADRVSLLVTTSVLN